MTELVEDDRGLVGWKVSRKMWSNGSEPVQEIIYTEELIG
jgi:hypothetical protein